MKLVICWLELKMWRIVLEWSTTHCCCFSLNWVWAFEIENSECLQYKYIVHSFLKLLLVVDNSISFETWRLEIDQVNLHETWMWVNRTYPQHKENFSHLQILKIYGCTAKSNAQQNYVKFQVRVGLYANL